MPATTSRIDFIQQEYRTANSVDATIQTKHPLAKKLSIDTFINTEADAVTLADAILGLRKQDRYNWSFILSERVRFSLTIGATYTITHPRFGLSAGKNFILRGVKWSSNSKSVEALFFGPQ